MKRGLNPKAPTTITNRVPKGILKAAYNSLEKERNNSRLQETSKTLAASLHSLIKSEEAGHFGMRTTFDCMTREYTQPSSQLKHMVLIRDVL